MMLARQANPTTNSGKRGVRSSLPPPGSSRETPRPGRTVCASSSLTFSAPRRRACSFCVGLISSLRPELRFHPPGAQVVPPAVTRGAGDRAIYGVPARQSVTGSGTGVEGEGGWWVGGRGYGLDCWRGGVWLTGHRLRCLALNSYLKITGKFSVMTRTLLYVFWFM